MRNKDAQAANKKFWMSDKNCNACDDCGAAFHTFRRRHHCRLCGRIFCDKCSSRTLDGIRYGFQGHIRVCNYCHQLAEKNRQQEDSDSDTDGTPLASPRLPTVFPSEDSKVKDDVIEGRPYMMEEGDTWTHRRSSDSDSDSEDEAEKKKHMCDPLADCMHKFDSENEREYHLHHICEYVNTPTNTYNLSRSESKSVESNASNSSLNSSPASVDQNSVEGKSPVEGKTAPNMLKLPAQTLEDPKEISIHQERIQEIHRQHLRRVVVKLLEIEQLDPVWKDIIVNFAVKATEKVHPQVQMGDQMDIRHYVKVKKIAGGSPSDCRYIDGVVFRKNIAHRKMRTRIENPRILLLSCALEWGRQVNRMSSLDQVWKQEKEYIEILVDKILSLKPDILVVQKTVARLAQQLLRENDVTLVLNVDASLMERIARSTKAVIESTTDHLDSKPKEKTLGTCQTFRTELFDDDLRGKKGRQTPLMFFEGCNTNLHCTIYLRGDTREVLQRVKAVMKQAVHVAYNLSLEAAFMNDQRATYVGVKDHEIPSPISLRSSSPFLDFPPPTHKRGDSRSSSSHHNTSSSNHATGESTSNSSTSLTGGEPGEAANQWLNQRLVFGSCWLMNTWQCFPPELKGIEFYTAKDKTLLEILAENCFDIKSRCVNHKCKKTILQHVLSYNHYHGRVIIRVTRLPAQLPKLDGKILMWSRCHECSQITPVVPMSDKTAHFSFGKFLELTFYNHSVRSRVGNCRHSVHRNHIRFFGLQDVVVSFEYQHISPYKVCRSLDLRERMKLSTDRHVTEREIIANVSRHMFAAFLWKIGELEEVCSNNVTTQEQISKSEKQLEELHKLKEIISKESTVFDGLVTDTKHEENLMWLNQLRRRLFICAQIWNTALPAIFRMRGYEQPSNIIQRTNTAPPVLRPPSSRSAPSSPQLKPESTPRPRRQSRGSFDDLILSDAFQRAQRPSSHSGRPPLPSPASAGGGDDRTNMQNLVDDQKSGVAVDIIAEGSHQTVQEEEGQNAMTREDIAEGEVSDEKNVISISSPPKENRQPLQPQSPAANSQRPLQSPAVVENGDDRAQPENFSSEGVPSPSNGSPDVPSRSGDHDAKLKMSREAAGKSLFTGYNNTRRRSSQIEGSSNLLQSIKEEKQPLSPSADQQKPVNQKPANKKSPPRQQEGQQQVSERGEKSGENHDEKSPYEALTTVTASVENSANKYSNKRTTTPSFADKEVVIVDKAPSIQKHGKEWSPTVQLDMITKVNDETKVSDSDEPMFSDSDFLDADTGHGHFSLPTGVNDMVVPVYSDEPSSIIAYTLSSKAHRKRLGDLYTEYGEKLATDKICDAMRREDDYHLEFEFKDMGFSSSPSATNSAAQSPQLQNIKNDVQLNLPSISEMLSDDARSMSMPVAIAKQSSEGKENHHHQDSASSSVDDRHNHHIQNGTSPPLNNLSSPQRPISTSRSSPSPDRSSSSLPNSRQHSSSSSERRQQSSAPTSSSSSSQNESNPQRSPTPLQLSPDSNFANSHLPIPQQLSRSVSFETSLGGSSSGNGGGNNAPNNGGGSGSHESQHSSHQQLPQSFEIPQLYPMPPFPQTPDVIKHASLKVDVTSFYCTVYFPKQFYALRQHYCLGDEKFIESLSRSLKWIATGGKSGSQFSKTLDDRFILKYVFKNEFKMFLVRAKEYLKYTEKAFFQRLPTVIVPTLGIYKVSCKSRSGKKMYPKYVVVMPNLFYGQSISRVFDLKGSMRSRYIKDATGDIVLLDENFMEFTQGFPIPLVEASKELLRVSVFNDTLFLGNLEIVDYSILVGIDDSNPKKPQLIVGVIDYNRQYTWDKVIETTVKSIGTVAGRSQPTILSPKNYKERFRAAMDRYFMVAPDRHTPMVANENDSGK